MQRGTLALLGAAVAALLAIATPVYGSADRHGHGKERRIVERIRHMSLEEKVGQLFVANVYGESAGTRDPADVAANNAMYGPGIDNANDLVDAYRLGGVVYFRWTHNLRRPRQIAQLSNGSSAPPSASGPASRC